MDQPTQPLRTKAFYKHQYQLVESLKPCSVVLTRLTEGETDALRKKNARSTLAPKPSKRANTSEPTRRRSHNQKKMRREVPSSSPVVVETIVISSDDEVPSTPPRRPPVVHDYPITPPPTVSPMAAGDTLTDLPPTPGRTLFMDTGFPPTPGRNMGLALSPRYAPDSESETEYGQPHINRRLEQVRSPNPPTVSSVVVVPVTSEKSVEDIQFECREMLPEEIRSELQPCLREALRRWIPHHQHKRVFTIGGKKLRVHVNRQGKTFVRML
ncbi:uncharacterized protein LOC131801255 isoform X2 [Musca domestica]|uniref:Uncharacterized protein LOC131801255 isoform X2 n=1 Tax=Musca domestica TaxID=7370 RepID=A0ABM3UQ84_MUSDO|nr:uncharacterized protein LOC131801255 isoform X2 [Musca domestica]